MASLNYDNYKSLATNDTIEAKIKLIILEYEYLKRFGDKQMPSSLSLLQMRQLLKCSRNVKRRNWTDHSMEMRKYLMQSFGRAENEWNNDNKLMLSLTYQMFNKHYTQRLITASLLSQNLVIDLSFDSFMSDLECKNCAEQLHRIYYYNRCDTIKLSAEPFNLHICNVNRSERTAKYIESLFPNINDNDLCCHITHKSYTELFPRENLIFLSPHASAVMEEYDHNAVFIIGGIVDRRKVIHLTHEKASKDGIRSMRLPLDSLQRKHNIQSLDDVVEVLHDLKSMSVTGDINWESSLRKRIPFYKLKTKPQIAFEEVLSQGIHSELNEMCMIIEEKKRQLKLNLKRRSRKTNDILNKNSN